METPLRTAPVPGCAGAKPEYLRDTVNQRARLLNPLRVRVCGVQGDDRQHAVAESLWVRVCVRLGKAR